MADRTMLALTREFWAGMKSRLEHWRSTASSRPLRTRGNSPTGDIPGTDIIQSFVMAIPDPAIVLDSEGTVLATNPQARELMGGQAQGRHIGRSLRNPQLMTALKEALATQAPTSFTLDIQQPSERHLDGSASPLAWPRRKPSEPAVIIVLQDISEREALARMRVEFVANASHELRTPLAALSGFIETLNGPAKNDQAARERFLAIMADQAQRMTRLIDDLLLLSRVEMRAHVVPSTTADLTHVVSEAIKLVASAAQRDNTEILFKNTTDKALIPGDHDELVQAVQNLLSNAVKYGKPGGRIMIELAHGQDRRSGKSLTLSVSDDGPGISPEHLPRLTERFYRVNNAASRDKGGTGLGLAIVKHIAMRHRGRVDVRSTEGVGTTFSLIFPSPLPTTRG